mgnify:FL=1
MNVNFAKSIFRGLALDGFTYDREDAGLTSQFFGEKNSLTSCSWHLVAFVVKGSVALAYSSFIIHFFRTH